MGHKIQLPAGDTVEAALSSLARADLTTQCFMFEQTLDQYYLSNPEDLRLTALVLLEQGLPVLTCIFSDPQSLTQSMPEVLFNDRASLLAWAEKNSVACFALDEPLTLSPVNIPKPWGEEVWFTGIEARGQSMVTDKAGRSVPLPWLLEVFPRCVSGARARDIILLKILAPLAEPVYGDLYFEMHEKKQEVYVVTAVDQRAWLDGVGGIRFGFCQKKRALHKSDDQFRKAYLEAVNNYQKVRREIDAVFDRHRQEEGVALDAPVDAVKTKRWSSQLPSKLVDLESDLRRELDSYAAVKKLSVGDVVKVPCFTPHSLMHGVTTVEFQTPVYERKILSFAQKVLTQGHWDTESALADVTLDAPVENSLPVIFDQAGVLREEVVRFDDFAVERISLSPKCAITLARAGEYALLMAVDGVASVQSYGELSAMQTQLIPASLSECRVINNNAEKIVFLYSYPLLSVS